jgi:DNA-directed RNA polymerase specialized sigma24 family protein
MSKRASGQAKRAEIEQALFDLKDADLLRLQRFARLRARLVPSMGWEDLLQEAIARLLDGRRKWPRSVKFVAFMRQTVRSIANEQWRRSQRAPEHAEFNDEALVQKELQTALEPERAFVASNLLDEINAVFAADPGALAVLSGLAAGESPQEIRARSKMSKIQYASAQKRIRRGLTRVFAEVGTLS